MISAWPSSMPRLKPISALRIGVPLGNVTAPAKPEPVQEAEGEHDDQLLARLDPEHLHHRHVDDRRGDQRLDDLARDVDDAEDRERERDAVGDRERGRELDHVAQLARAEQQDDQEDDVVPAEHDVLDALLDEAREVRAVGGHDRVVGVEQERALGAAELVVDDVLHREVVVDLELRPARPGTSICSQIARVGDAVVALGLRARHPRRAGLAVDGQAHRARHVGRELRLALARDGDQLVGLQAEHVVDLRAVLADL